MASETMLSTSNRALRTSATPLHRQGSIYSLTLEEVQNSLIESGKNFGSMSMDEFWKNIWTAEEGQAMAVAMLGNVGTDFQNNLQQGSLTLPRTLSRKTVDEVWKEIQRHKGQEDLEEQKQEQKQEQEQEEEQEQKQRQQQQQQQRLGGYGEMTLEDFLVKAGVVRDDMDVGTSASNGTASSFNSTFGAPTPRANVESIPQNQQQLEWYNYQLKQQRQQQQQQQFLLQKQAEVAAAAMAGVANKRTGPIGGMLLPGSIRNMLETPLDIEPGLVPENLASSLSLSPRLVSSAAPDTPTKRPVYDIMDNAVERRQRRMIKNRESAARSRARKQAYTVELEAEVMQLKDEISRLKRQQTFGPSKETERPLRVLRRTRSTYW